MAGYDVIIYLFTNMFRVYVIARFFRAFLEIDEQKYKKEFILYSLYYICNSVLYLWLKSPIVNLIVTLLGLGLITMVYSNTIQKKVLIILLVFSVTITWEGLATLFFNNYRDSELENIAATVLSVFLSFLTELLIERRLRINEELKIGVIQWVALLIMPASSILVLVLIILRPLEERSLSVLILGVLIAINIATFYLYDLLLKSKMKEWESKMLESQIKMLESQFIIQRKSQENMRGLRHDMKSHLRNLADMIEGGKKEDALNYMHSMYSFIENRDEYIDTGNEQIDSVLNYLIPEAKAIGTEVRIDVKVPVQLPIDAFDINVILNNLLSNSIEALKNVSDKKMDIDIKYAKSLLCIQIANTFDGKLNIKDKRIYTRKSKTSEHGIGLKNVERIVKKYGGNCVYEVNREIFNIKTILYC